MTNNPLAYGAVKYNNKYFVKYTRAFNFFCDLNGLGVGQQPLSVWNYRSEGQYDESNPDEILTWKIDPTDMPAAVGKYFVIEDYKTIVNDPYDGIMGNYPRYKTKSTDKGYQLGFTVPQSWMYDPFPQKVSVELFVQNDSYNLVTTGLTGEYTLCNCGGQQIEKPAFMAGEYWPEIYEYVDAQDGMGMLLRVDYAANGVSLPYDWTSIIFLRPFLKTGGAFLYPQSEMDDPSVEGTPTYIFYKYVQKLRTTSITLSKYIGADYYMTEAQLWTLASNMGIADPSTWWADPDDSSFRLTASGTRVFAVYYLYDTPDTWPKATIDLDPSAMILIEVINSGLYAYTFADHYPTSSESNITSVALASLPEVVWSEPTPAARMIEPATGAYDESTFYGLPCTVMYGATYLGKMTAKYVTNTNIVLTAQSDLIVCEELWTSALVGKMQNLLLRSAAAYFFCMANVELVSLLKQLYVVSLMQNMQYEFFFDTLTYKDIVVSSAIDHYATLPFATLLNKWYEVRIFGNSYSGTTLTGSPSPITLSEENTKFAFEQIRDQSGYLQILNANNVVDQFIPEKVSSCPIGLYDITAQKYVWCGYIKPEVFTRNAYAYKEIVRLPIIGAMYAARSIPFTVVFPDERDMTVGAALATALYLIMKQHPVVIENVVIDYAEQFFGGTTDVPEEQSWMKAKINTGMFQEWDDDYNTQRWGYDCAEVVKMLCSFFGLSCRVQGTTVYFLALDDNRHEHKLGRIAFSSLVATGFIDGYTPEWTEVQAETLPSVFSGPFASTKTETSLTAALGEVSVSCDTDIQANDFDIWGEWVVEDQWSRIVSGSYPSSNFERKSWSGLENRGSLNTEFRLLPDMTKVGYEGWQAQAKVKYDSQVPSQTLDSVVAYIGRKMLMQNAVLSVNLSTIAYRATSIPTMPEEIENHTETFRIRVSGFTTDGSATSFEAEAWIVDGELQTDPILNRRLLPNYPGIKIASFDGSQFLYGSMKVEVHCMYASATASNEVTVIDSLSLHITPMLGGKEPKTEFRHKIFEYAAGGNKSITSQLISAYIPSIQNRVTSVERYNAILTDYNPSENLAQRMADYHGKPRRAYKLHIKGDYADSGITPLGKIQYDGKQYITIAVEQDVASSSYTLTLIEMPAQLEN